MIQLSEQNVTDYLRSTRRLAPGDQPPLVQSLSGGIANIVLKIFDHHAGSRLGTDTRSPAQIKRNVPDPRMTQGACFVLKQPLEKFRTQAEWIVDTDRVLVERDAMAAFAAVLPAGSVPEVLWFDEINRILAISCAPTGAVLWKKQLLAGRISAEAAQHAGMLLAILHSATKGDAVLRERFGDLRLFRQQRTDPYLAELLPKHPDLRAPLESVIQSLLTEAHCVIHGDYSPKNIFLIPASEPPAEIAPPRAGKARGPKPPTISHLLLLDFEVVCYGHPIFDVATLINHLLLKAFYLRKPWRAAMIAIDAFWQTYQHTADKQLAALAERHAGHVLGALLLARVDGKSPAEYLPDDDNGELKNAIRACARAILQNADQALEPALDLAATALQERSP